MCRHSATLNLVADWYGGSHSASELLLSVVHALAQRSHLAIMRRPVNDNAPTNQIRSPSR